MNELDQKIKNFRPPTQVLAQTQISTKNKPNLNTLLKTQLPNNNYNINNYDNNTKTSNNLNRSNNLAGTAAAGCSTSSCLPNFNCGNAAGNVTSFPVQVGVGSTGNCVPDNNQNIQINSVGVCVQGVDLGCAVPNLSVIDSCAGNQTNTSMLPNGQIYNTNICNTQPLIGIPGVFCNSCNQSSMSCNCSAANKMWYKLPTNKSKSTNKMTSMSSHKSGKSIKFLESSSSSSKSNDDGSYSESYKSFSSSSSNYHPKALSSMSLNKVIPQTASNPNIEILPDPIPRPRRKITVEYTDSKDHKNSTPAIAASQPAQRETKSSAGCTNSCGNTCGNTCANMCGTCNGCQCISPCADVGINKVVPCNCNFLAVSIGQQSECNTCGNQTANMSSACCMNSNCSCNNCNGCNCSSCCNNCCDSSMDCTTTMTTCCSNSSCTCGNCNGCNCGSCCGNCCGNSSGNSCACAKAGVSDKSKNKSNAIAKDITKHSKHSKHIQKKKEVVFVRNHR